MIERVRRLRRHARHLWMWLFTARIIEVYHQDSPGIRVLVKRNYFQELISPRASSRIGERHWSAYDCFPGTAHTPSAQHALDRAHKNFEAYLWLAKVHGWI